MRAPPVRSLVFAVVVAVVALFVAVPAAGGAPPAETGTVWFSVDPNSEFVNGFPGGDGWVGTVTVQVFDETFTTMLATRTTTAAGGGFTANFGPADAPGWFDLVAGQSFVATDGIHTKVITDTDLRLTGSSFDTDLVAGDGAVVGRDVGIGTWSEWPTTLPDTGMAAVIATPAPDGTWVGDLGAAGVDLRPARVHVAAHQTDDNGDGFQAMLPVEMARGTYPHLDVSFPRHVTAQGYAVGAMVTLHAVWPDTSTYDETALVGAQLPGQPTMAAFAIPRDLEPGTVLTLEGATPAWILDPAFGNRELEVTDIGVADVDLDTSTVHGFAGPERNVELYPNEPGYQGPWARRHTYTDALGGFPPQSFAVPGDEASAGGRMGIEDTVLTLTAAGAIGLSAFDEPDFDIQSTYRPNVVLRPSVYVDPSEGLSHQQSLHVWGEGFEPDAQVGVAEGDGTGANFVILGWFPTDGAGNFDATVQVQRYVNGVDMTETGAQLTAFDPSDPWGRNSSVWLSFLPMPDPITVTVNPTGSASRVSGWATVGGTATCSLAGGMELNGSVWQVIKKTSVTMGTFTVGAWCDQPGDVVDWEAVVLPSGMPLLPFVAGLAQVDVDAEQWRWGDRAFGSMTFDVKLIAPKPSKPR